MTRVLGLLGLGARAGQLLVGVEAVRAGLQSGRVALVALASDASPRALEKVVRLADARGVPRVSAGPAAELGERLGRPPVMVVGVRDAALARGVADAAARQQF